MKVLCLIQLSRLQSQKAIKFNATVDISASTISIGKGKSVSLKDKVLLQNVTMPIITNINMVNFRAIRNIYFCPTMGIPDEHIYTMDYLSNLHLFNKNEGREGQDYFMASGDSTPNKWRWDMGKMSEEFLVQVLLTQFFIHKQKVNELLG